MSSLRNGRGGGQRWLHRALAISLAVVMVIPGGSAFAAPLPAATPEQRHDPTQWMAINRDNDNGSVAALEYAPDGTLYVGGAFTHMGPPTGGFGVVSADSGLMPASGEYPYVDGYVYAAIPDGSGGYFIGGDFESVGGVPRRNVARINADGSLNTAWDVGAVTGGSVYSLAILGSWLYVGGDFLSIGGFACPRLARVSTTTGAVGQFFSPSPSNQVLALATLGDKLYVGGLFTWFGTSTQRNYLASIDPSNILSPVTAWNPNPNGVVRALAIDNTYLFAGGNFTTVGGVTRNRVARFSVADGSLSEFWDPDVSATVQTIAINKDSTEGAVNRVLLGGWFTTVDGVARSRTASVNYTNGELSGVQPPTANDHVYSIAVTPAHVYFGGRFDTFLTQNDQRIARCNNDFSLSYDNAWDTVNAGEIIYCMVPSGSSLAIGGDIGSVGAHPRKGIAALAADGSLKSWYPTGGVSGLVRTIEATNNGKLYIGGDFTTVGGVARNNLAELSPSTAAALSFNPNVGLEPLEAGVYDIESDGATVWFGGEFSTVDGAVRQNIAAVDAAGDVTEWYWGEGANDVVRALERTADSKLYVGGDFTGIFSLARNYIALVNTGSAAVQVWNPALSSTTAEPGVYDVLLDGARGLLYIAGEFTAVGADARSNLAAVSTSTGAATSWRPDPIGGRVNAIARSANDANATLFIGGYFDGVYDTARESAAAVHPSGYTGTAVDAVITAWRPHTSGTVSTVAANGAGVVIGGYFTKLYVQTSEDRYYYGNVRYALDETPPVGTMLINDDAASTSTRSVTLRNALPGGDSPDWTMQRFKQAEAISWGAWERFSYTKAWTLTAGDGTKTVQAQFMDESGNVSLVSDTIVLDTTTPPPALTVTPVAGAGRVETAIEASKLGFADGSSEYVVIATARSFPDALGGSALAGALDAPILLTEPATLSAAVSAEIARLGVTKVIVLGGTGAVSASVFDALDALPGVTAERISGANRYATAEAIAERTISEMGAAWDGTAFVATGESFPDALGASPIAAAKGWPIYLVHPNPANHDALVATMDGDGVASALILGGTGPVPASFETKLDAAFGGLAVDRLAGSNRYTTAVTVATFGVEQAGLSWDAVAIATGEDFPDALSGGALQGASGSVMLLAYPGYLHTEVGSVLTANKAIISEVRFLGGTGAVPQTIRDAVVLALQQ